MEAALTVNGNREWLVHGPDINGVYGGLQGTGGLEEVCAPPTGNLTWLASDIYGHVEATGTAASGTVTWNAVKCGGYGPLPGSAAQPIDATHDVSAALAWNGKYIDGTGLYYLGARYYNPRSGTFLSPDPMGHEASMDLYSYAGNDPVNSIDSDGRCTEGNGSGVNGDGMIDSYQTPASQQLELETLHPELAAQIQSNYQ